MVSHTLMQAGAFRCCGKTAQLTCQDSNLQPMQGLNMLEPCSSKYIISLKNIIYTNICHISKHRKQSQYRRMMDSFALMACEAKLRQRPNEETMSRVADASFFLV